MGDSLARFIQARSLLATVLDDHRAIVGRVSRAWISSEAERRLPWESLPPALQRRLRPAGDRPPDTIQSNWLPKLEPCLDAHVLAGVILLGARLFGRGTPDPEDGAGFGEIDDDLVAAAMVHPVPGLLTPWPEAGEALDELGPGVLERIGRLREHLARFDDALAGGRPSPPIPPDYANAVAAVKAAELRLTARAAGDGIFSLLDEAKRDELSGKGVDPGARGALFPERPPLERDYAAARAALDLPGVDEAIRGPVGDVLLRSVEHVLRHGTPPAELVGRYGSAVRNFHCALPLWEHYSTIVRRTRRGPDGRAADVAGPFAPGTLFVTSLEVTRYLHNVRRKGGRTGAGHSFLVASRVERLLGTHVSVPLVAASDCHDVVEDGSYAASGYDQDLELFAARFGAPLAALVAEVTDSITRDDGPAKAATTVRHPGLVPIEAVYDLGQLSELRARATDPETPFTLQGIVLKLADFGTTQEEGLRDPDLLSGVWRHSGARITWDHRTKGRIVRPLVERVRAEIQASRDDPQYRERPWSLSPELVDRLAAVLRWSLDTSDLYLAQNLAILAAEHGLDAAGREGLLTAFLDEAPPEDPALALDRLDRLLRDDRLDPDLRRRGLPATYRLVPGGPPVRDLTRLVEVREAARRRREIRRELGLPPLERARVAEVLLLPESAPPPATA